MDADRCYLTCSNKNTCRQLDLATTRQAKVVSPKDTTKSWSIHCTCTSLAQAAKAGVRKTIPCAVNNFISNLCRSKGEPMGSGCRLANTHVQSTSSSSSRDCCCGPICGRMPASRCAAPCQPLVAAAAAAVVVAADQATVAAAVGGRAGAILLRTGNMRI